MMGMADMEGHVTLHPGTTAVMTATITAVKVAKRILDTGTGTMHVMNLKVVAHTAPRISNPIVVSEKITEMVKAAPTTKLTTTTEMCAHDGPHQGHLFERMIEMVTTEVNVLLTAETVKQPKLQRELTEHLLDMHSTVNQMTSLDAAHHLLPRGLPAHHHLAAHPVDLAVAQDLAPTRNHQEIEVSLLLRVKLAPNARHASYAPSTPSDRKFSVHLLTAKCQQAIGSGS